jgi:DNA-binding NarL/FixJ family response regulator
VALRTYFVEDNRTIRENLIETLEELANVRSVGFAETEADALAWLDAHPDEWDLMIVDLFLRGGSGMGVLQHCRNRSPGRKVVVLSNYTTPDVRVRCLQMGADAVYDKSNEIEALVDFCLGRIDHAAAKP